MTTYDKTKTTCFPRAALYPGHRKMSGVLREPQSGRSHFAYTERHVQCVWYDPRLRPNTLRTYEGETVTIEDPGIWNLEAGPDFLGAVVRVEPGRRRLSGDVEVHIHPSGWTQHGHAGDPRYAGVRFHTTFFPGTVPADLLPPGTLQVSLKQGLDSDPLFSFEKVDLTAYPYAARAPLPPCADAFRAWSPDEKGAVLDAAGEERLRRKAERLAERVRETNREQALYEEVMAALGYKHNKMPFRTLAERLPLAHLRELSTGDDLVAYALLAGLAGLLPDQLGTAWPEASRRFVRELWDRWWKVRDEFEGRVLDRTVWRLAGLRPSNHPLRRLRAASLIFGGAVPPEQSWAHSEMLRAEDALDQVQRSLAGFHCDFWSYRLSLRRAALPEPVALLGPSRIHAIIVNVLVPYLAATGSWKQAPAKILDTLPRETSNRIIRLAGHQFFGPDHPTSLYRSALRRQGLLQIFEDYCLNDRSRCAACPFPAALRAYATRHR